MRGGESQHLRRTKQVTKHAPAAPRPTICYAPPVREKASVGTKSNDMMPTRVARLRLRGISKSGQLQLTKPRQRMSQIRAPRRISTTVNLNENGYACLPLACARLDNEAATFGDSLVFKIAVFRGEPLAAFEPLRGHEADTREQRQTD